MCNMFLGFFGTRRSVAACLKRGDCDARHQFTNEKTTQNDKCKTFPTKESPNSDRMFRCGRPVLQSRESGYKV